MPPHITLALEALDNRTKERKMVVINLNQTDNTKA